MTHCPDCGEQVDSPDCGHRHEGAGKCHVSPLLPCPNHFTRLNAEAMCSAPGDDRDFIAAIDHLNGDGMVVTAWYTWVAMIGQFSVPPGMSREQVLRQRTRQPEVPDDAPDYFRAALPLVTYTCRAAISGDWETVEATLAVANNTLDGEGVLCFLKSIAASAHSASERNDSCTVDHLSIYNLIGSQVHERVGGEVLPYLVNMTIGHLRGKDRFVNDVFDALIALPGTEPLVCAVNLVASTLAQITSADATVLTGGGAPGTPGATYEGMVDVERATEENTDRAVMAGVWTVRAAQAYSGAKDHADATARIQDVVRSHGKAGRFAMDVVLAGTQMIAYSYSASEAAAKLAEPPS